MTSDWKRCVAIGVLGVAVLSLTGCLRISFPKGGDVVIGLVTITAGESDAEERFRDDEVQFYIDGILRGSDRTTPYTFPWDSRSVADGWHTLVAKAFSLTKQKEVTSATVKVYVRNTPTGDATPPTGSIQINAGAAFTRDPKVTLTLAATDDSGTVAQMRFSNDNVTYTAPELYAATKAWTLPAGDGPKTVYVHFKDAASPTTNWSDPASGTIILDTSRPTTPGQPTEGGFDPESELDVTNTSSYLVAWSAASDAESGIIAYKLQEAPSASGPWSLVSKTITSTDYLSTDKTHGTTSFYRVKARNGAGQWGEFSPVSDGIRVDQQPPQFQSVGFTDITTNSMVVNWTTDEPAICYLVYESDQNTGVVDLPDIPSTTYQVPITGLVEFTEYGVTIYCTDRLSNGNNSESGKYLVWTKSDAPTEAEPFEVEGAVFVSWWQDEYKQTPARRSLLNLAKTGADYVGIITTWYLDPGPGSTDEEKAVSNDNTIERHPDKTPNDDALRQAIQWAKRLDRNVFLKLHVNVILNNEPRGNWRDTWAGQIQPSDPTAWFNSYRDFAVHYAQIAEEEGVALLAFGTELPTRTIPAYTSQWRSIINAVKQVYHGKLTFSSHFDIEFSQIGFWDLCDYLGIGPYFSLTPSDASNPGLDAIVNGWRNSSDGGDVVQHLSQWSAQHAKPVLFTELGYCSVDATTSRAFGCDKSRPENQALQQRAYDALFLMFQKQPWFAGVFWWNWLTDPNAGTSGDSRKDYTPQNKLAQSSLMNFFLGVKTTDVANLRIVDGNGVELPDGTTVGSEASKNLFATGTTGDGASLGYVPAVWSLTGSAATLTSNDVGYARLVGVTRGSVRVTATLNGRSDSVDLTIGPAGGLRVPSQYPTIQAAADVAQSGDTILVAPGTYAETITLPTGVRLISEAGADETTIDARDKSFGVLGGQRVEGFTIRGATVAGIGRGTNNFTNTTKEIIHNVIKNNGHGIDLYRGGQVLIANNLILDNSTTEYGGGVRLDGGVAATVVNNVVANNTAYDGGGIYVSSSADSVVLNNIIVANAGTYGGGVRVWAGGSCEPQPIVDFNDAWNNTGAQQIYMCGPPPGNISADPKFVNPEAGDYHLQDDSPSFDAGHGDEVYNDLPPYTAKDGPRNDMGAYGGPAGDW